MVHFYLRILLLVLSISNIISLSSFSSTSSTSSRGKTNSLPTSTILIYPDVVRPEFHPRYNTTLTLPPTWAEFSNITHFATLRGFSQTSNNTIINYEQTLQQYLPLGDIIWPVYTTLFAPNFAEVIEYMNSLNLFVTDFWGYVPGSGPGGEMWQAYTPPNTSLNILNTIMGVKSFGLDVGEQDGRYIGAYSDQHYPLHGSIHQQRKYFEQHFQAMYNQLGLKVTGLQSLTFGHSMGQSGLFTVLGCETAQALVNGQLFYAITRGAGKMYGFLYFGNVSVYNRFGYKTYTASSSGLSALLEQHRLTRGGGTRTDTKNKVKKFKTKNTKGTNNDLVSTTEQNTNTTGYNCNGQGGPTCGTSLSLMIKLMFAQIIYNSAYVSFESAWFDENNNLTPIGQIQLAARQWINSYGSPGVHVANFALVLDNAAGFTVPRHLYTSNIYRTWGNLPYSLSRGDYLIDNYLQLIYPSYRDSSYYHNETGFSSLTPYGDSLDILLSDSPSWLLARYDTILLASTPQTELGLLRTKLNTVLRQASSNRIISFAGSLGAWSSAGLGNCSIQESEYTGNWINRCTNYPAGTVVTVLSNDGSGNTVNITESSSFAICTVQCTAATNTVPIAWINNVPIAYKVTSLLYSGNLVLFGSPFGVAITPVPVSDPGVDAALQTPYPFLQHITYLLDSALQEKTLFNIPGLTYAMARKSGNNPDTITGKSTNNVTYTLVISNPTLNEAPFSIESNVGTILSMNEIIVLNDTIRTSTGYLPDGFENSNLGNSTPTTIAGVDTRVFEIVIAEQDTSTSNANSASITVLPTTPPLPRPHRVALSVNNFDTFPVHTLQDLILYYPSLSQYFDTFLVDWKYIASMNTTSLVNEANYLRQTGFMQGIVDFTSGLNLYPDLRLFNNSEPEYTNTINTILGVMEKMYQMNWNHVILSLHRTPENNMDESTAIALFVPTLQYLNTYANQYNITIHLRNAFKSPLGGISATQSWLKTNKLDQSIRILSNIGSALAYGETENVINNALQTGPGSIGLLGISCPLSDLTSNLYTDTFPISLNCENIDTIMQIVQSACQVGNCLDNSITTDDGTSVNIVLIVDTYTGMDALMEPIAGTVHYDIDINNIVGPYLGPNFGTGSILDLAYQEIMMILNWLNYNY